MALGDRFECSSDVSERLDAVDLGGLDQGCDPTPGATALVVTCEESILPVQGNWANEIFDCVGVDFDTAIGQESLKSVPMAVNVSELLTQTGLRRHARSYFGEPLSEVLDQGRGACFASGQSLSGADAADVRFDFVELGDAAQALGGDLGTVAIEDLSQFAPCMRPAVGDGDWITALAI